MVSSQSAESPFSPTWHVDVAACYVQARMACVDACVSGSVYGLVQGQWPRLCSPCVNNDEAEAHDYEALEPQSRLINNSATCHWILLLPPCPMVCTSLGLRATMRWSRCKEPVVFAALQQLLLVRLLDGEDVAPDLVEE